MSSIKPWKELTFTDDYMFKKVMEAADICTESLNAFLSWDIKRITYFEEEKPLQAFYDSKGVRLDVEFLAKGSLYSDLRPTIILFFCPFPLFDSNFAGAEHP